MQAYVRGGGLADIFPFTSNQDFWKILKLRKGNIPNFRSMFKIILNKIGQGFPNSAKLKTLSNDT
jgi:hypothetical protein